MGRRRPRLTQSTTGPPSRSGRADLASAVAAVVGSLPGFTLPFVAAVVLAPGQADLLLLALSVGITPAIIVSSAVELTTIAEYGRLLGRDRGPAPDALRTYGRKIARFGVLLGAVVVPVLILGYAARSPDPGTFVALAGVVAVTPVLAAVASRLSGESVARGAPVVPIAVQAMRSLLPAVLLLAWPSAPLLLLAAMLPAGEAVRAVLLGVACRRLRRAQGGDPTGELTPYGLVAQALSSGVTQLGPAVDRVYLASAGPGYIAGYEIADRLVYAASQFFSMTFLVRRVALWARLPTMDAEAAGRMLRRDARTLGGLGLLLTAVGAAACLAALGSGLLPADWQLGFWWGALVMVSLPAHIFNVVGTRLLVVGRKQHYMLGIAAATAVLNAALDALGYALLGPIGIVVSTVLVRWVMAGVYLHLLRTVVPQTIAQDLPPD